MEGETGRAFALAHDMANRRAAVKYWRGLADQTSRICERESKRIMAFNAVVTGDQFNHVMATIGAVLNQHLDPPLLAAIRRDLSTHLAGLADAPLAIGAAAAG
jgi:hypothetical protein